MENPATGLLRDQPVVSGIPYYLADYCSYPDERLGRFMEYRKRTAFWTNGQPQLCLCLGGGMCPSMVQGKGSRWHHIGSCGNGNTQFNVKRRSSKADKYLIPSTLVKILLTARVNRFETPLELRT